MKFWLELKDCIEWLESLDDESVDLIVTDPAYESLEKHRAVGTTTRLKADWFPIFKNDRFAKFLIECYRVLKDDTHIYIYCDQETMHVLHEIVHEDTVSLRAPFHWWKFLVWDKARTGMGYHYRASHECIVFLEKGKRKLNDLGIRDVLSGPSVRGGYPTEKNVSVTKVLIEQSSNEGDLIIDPFLGSGSTGHAALMCARNFAGCDVVQHAFALAQERLRPLGKEDDFLRRKRAPSQGSLW